MLHDAWSLQCRRVVSITSMAGQGGSSWLQGCMGWALACDPAAAACPLPGAMHAPARQASGWSNKLAAPPSHAPAAAEFALAEPHAALGTRLTVQLPAGLQAGDTVKVGARCARCSCCAATPAVVAVLPRFVCSFLDMGSTSYSLLWHQLADCSRHPRTTPSLICAGGHRLCGVSPGLSGAVAAPGADGGQEAPIPIHAVPSHPRTVRRAGRTA